jgi:hypothetical protein
LKPELLFLIVAFCGGILGFGKAGGFKNRGIMIGLSISAIAMLVRVGEIMLELRDERVYEIEKTSPGAYRPLVVAITSKTSAQRLMAQLAEERGLQDQGRYRMFAFTHPPLPGLERTR